MVNYAFIDFAFEQQTPALARLAAIKREHPQLKMMASVGGWTGSGPFSNMASTAASRAAFIDAALGCLRRTGFDGIDLDWEYPTEIGVPCDPGVICERPEDKRNFVVLVREMRAALGNRYLLTIAAGADEKFVSGQWIAELSQSLDWINLMTYDYHGSLGKTSGLNAPIDRDPRDATGASARESVERLIANGGRETRSRRMPSTARSGRDASRGRRDGLYQRCERYVAESTYGFPDPASWRGGTNLAACLTSSTRQRAGSSPTTTNARSGRRAGS